MHPKGAVLLEGAARSGGGGNRLLGLTGPAENKTQHINRKTHDEPCPSCSPHRGEQRAPAPATRTRPALSSSKLSQVLSGPRLCLGGHPRVSKLASAGQIQPAVSFGISCQLRMVFVFSNGYIFKWLYKYVHNSLEFASWSTKHKTFTIWPFKKKFANPWSSP